MKTFFPPLIFPKFNRLLQLVFLLGMLCSGGNLYGQMIELHPCAAARLTSTPNILADGITSLPHRELMRQYNLHWYKLDLNLERNSLDISGNVILYASSLSDNLNDFAFELHPNFTIQQVLVDGAASTVRRSGAEVIVPLPMAKARQQKFRVQIFYAGRAPSGAGAAIGNGYNTAVAMPWNEQITWSLSEPFAASEWFPVKQLLDDKADSVEVWVTTSVENKVGSNGLLQRVTPMPNQKHRYEWRSTYPIAYYLISVAIGRYDEYTYNITLPGATKPMLFQNYIYPQSLATYKADIDKTGQFLQLFSELFGLYPFYQEKYGHSMAPLGGGMEHQTMTTQDSFDFSLTAHELAHQWWGDEVTCADWSHIWLNEGFASYGEYLAIDAFLPSQKMNWLTRTTQFALSQPQGSVFVKDSTNVGRIFSSALSYRKGAMVLHMLRHTLQSDELFFQVLRAYRQAYRYDVATTRDFQRVVEQVTGKSFKYFFDQWVYGEGFPVFDVAWAQRGNEVFLRSSQTTSSAATPFFKTEVEYRITTSTKDTLIVVQHDEPIENYQFKVSGTVQNVVVDPDQWLLEVVREVVNDATIIPPAQVSTEALVYPNPTTGQVFFNAGMTLPEQVSIYDMVGRLLRTFVPAEPYFFISDLPAGVYLFHLKMAGGEVKKVKVVKV